MNFYSRFLNARFWLFLFLFVGCNSVSNSSSDIKETLSNAYTKLFYITNALEYPSTQSSLDKCIEANYEPCLSVYNEVKKAKSVIVDIVEKNDQKSLKVTLDLIREYCPIEGRNIQREKHCTGSIIALYFFDQSHHQKEILRVLTKIDQRTLNHMFSNTFAWHHNRPNKNEWIKFINSLSDETLKPNMKKIIIDAFEQPKTKITKFGVML